MNIKKEKEKEKEEEKGKGKRVRKKERIEEFNFRVVIRIFRTNVILKVLATIFTIQ